MIKTFSKVLLLVLTVSFTLVPTVGANEHDIIRERPGMGEMYTDVLLRPVYMATTLLGTGVFILGSPFSILGGNLSESFSVLVAKPFSATFFRCLGCKRTNRSTNVVEQ